MPPITPPGERGYTRSDIFVTTEWLADHLSDANVRVVDTDVPEEYANGHIPGAVNPVDHYYKTSLEDRTHIAGPEQFARTMADLGIGDDTTVVGYDRSGGVYSFRLMWALHYYGHTDVKFLDGGLPKWVAEGREITTDAVSVAGTGASFTPGANSDIFASRDRVLEAIDDDSTVLLDVRSDDEWTGVNKRGGPRGGRIPGAVHLEWVDFHTGGDVPVLRTADEIRKLLADVGITPDKNVIAY
ncbi:MAG: rhodanese-like domain-containing protein [Dehalococcoidia bacterium]|mgnify:CR=1 FL=1|nr:rhodanese-like domain-containing protein [Dehalococcoidia bacterium]